MWPWEEQNPGFPAIFSVVFLHFKHTGNLFTTFLCFDRISKTGLTLTFKILIPFWDPWHPIMVFFLVFPGQDVDSSCPADLELGLPETALSFLHWGVSSAKTGSKGCVLVGLKKCFAAKAVQPATAATRSFHIETTECANGRQRNQHNTTQHTINQIKWTTPSLHSNRRCNEITNLKLVFVTVLNCQLPFFMFDLLSHVHSRFLSILNFFFPNSQIPITICKLLPLNNFNFDFSH